MTWHSCQSSSLLPLMLTCERTLGLGFCVCAASVQLGPYGLHHDRTDPTLLATYAKVLPGYTVRVEHASSAQH